MDTTARLWDAKTGKELSSLVHTNKIKLALFSSTGDTIITVYSEGYAVKSVVIVWKRFGQSDCIGERQESAKELLVRKFCPRLSRNLPHNCLADAKGSYVNEEISEKEASQKSSILSFTQAINLDEDSQKECSIQ